MTKQEVFNRVYKHMMAMVDKSYNSETDMCAYRSPDGNKCAIGALIDDRHYYLDLEGKGANSQEVLDALAKSGLDACEVDSEMARFLQQLQEIHDWEFYKRQQALEFFAEQNNLTIPK